MKDMRHRIRPLDGLRGIAILMVVLSHLGASIDGAVGVQIFFVISGYLISSHILAEILISGKFDFKHFYLRRFARLFPTLLLVSILTVVFLIAYKIPLQEWKLGPLGALTSTMNFIQIFLGNENVSWAFQFTWSLSVEEQFYLIWPVTLWCTFRKLKFPLRRLKISIILLTSLCIILNHWMKSPDFHRDYPNIDVSLASPISVVGILFGCLIAIFSTSPIKLEIYFGNSLFEVLSWLAFVALIIASYKSETFEVKHPLYISTICTCILVMSILRSSKSPLARLLSFRFLVFIGTISYTLYLTNLLTGRFLDQIFKIHLNDYMFQSLYFAIGLLVSWVIYNYFENPLRKWLNSLQRSE